MTTPTADDFLMGSGVKSAKFETIGAAATGTIAQPPDVQQQRDFDSGEPKFWSDSKPMLQLRVVLNTTQRDPGDPEDDGQRAVYVKGQMQKAVQQAVRSSGAKGLEVGGTLTVTFISEEPNSRGRGNPKKVYSAAYRAPDVLAAVAEPAPSGLLRPAPSAAPAGPVSAPAGIDPAVWNTLSTEQQAAVVAATPSF